MPRSLLRPSQATISILGSRRGWRAKVVLCAVALVSALSSAANAAVAVSVVSSRPDMVSGGDALIAIHGVSGKDWTARLNGIDVTASFRPDGASRRLLGLVTGLKSGRNVLQVSVHGMPQSTFEMINHPRVGPLFSGPHQKPLICETITNGLGAPQDADCSAGTLVQYFYKSTQPVSSVAEVIKAKVDATLDPTPGGLPPGFKPYDPSRPPPGDVVRTVLSDGRTVNYIVRREVGTINRAVYEIEFLHEPGQPLPTPWTGFSAAWNGRLVYGFKGWGCGRYGQGKLGSAATADYEPLLAKGYAYATSTFNATRYNCNDLLSAETLSMVKESFSERFGAPLHTIGVGGSGGSMQLYLIAQNFPGLLDGIVPYISLPDMVSYEVSMSDCALLEHATDSAKLPWTEAEKSAVSGYATWHLCETGAQLALLDTSKCGPWVPADRIYDRRSDPGGLKCGYFTGRARRPIDNVGVQYGLLAFNEGQIDAEHFIELNELAGGYDEDGKIISARTEADPQALASAYASGLVVSGGGGLGQLPIIDWRPYSDDLGDIHVRFWSIATRARLMAANESAVNHVVLTGPRYDFGRLALGYDLDGVFGDALATLVPQMDRWLDGVTGDHRPGSASERIARNKPAGLADGCTTVTGETFLEAPDMARTRACNQLYSPYGDPRIAAGAPIAHDVLKCALEPVDAMKYSQPLDAVQLGRLRAIFAAGVCDFTRPGVGQEAPLRTWQRYESQ